MDDDLYTISLCLAFFLHPEERANLALTCKICCAAVRSAEGSPELLCEKQFVFEQRENRKFLGTFFMPSDKKIEKWITQDARVVAFVLPIFARTAIFRGDLQLAARIIDNFPEEMLCELLRFAPQFAFEQLGYSSQISTESYVCALSLCKRPRHCITFEDFIVSCDSAVSLGVLKAIARIFCNANFEELRAEYEKYTTKEMEDEGGRYMRKVQYAFLNEAQHKELRCVLSAELLEKEEIVNAEDYDPEFSSLVDDFGELRSCLANLDFIESTRYDVSP